MALNPCVESNAVPKFGGETCVGMQIWFEKVMTLNYVIDLMC
jgi:hypothetical protein